MFSYYNFSLITRIIYTFIYFKSHEEKENYYSWTLHNELEDHCMLSVLHRQQKIERSTHMKIWQCGVSWFHPEPPFSPANCNLPHLQDIVIKSCVTWVLQYVSQLPQLFTNLFKSSKLIVVSHCKSLRRSASGYGSLTSQQRSMQKLLMLPYSLSCHMPNIIMEV